MNNELIEKSKEILKSYNIEELEKSGIKINRKAFGTSHIIVTYPPSPACSRISQEEIFTNKKIKRGVALYIHIPFCTGKCLYCHYVTFANQPVSITAHYLSYLKKELEILLKIPALQDMNIKSIYVGGGTPTYLTVAQLSNFMGFLNEKLNISKDAEITWESSPETLIEENGHKKLKTLLEKGANRLSIGVQSFNDKVLKTAGRRHNAKEAIMAFELARSYGFRNVDIEFMMGLPEQTLQTWGETLKKIEKLKPESVTSYHLRIKPFVPFFDLFQRQLERFPSNDEILLMCIMLREKLAELGYKENPSNWFTRKPEFLYKHQEQKWKGTAELLALGVSSYSFINNVQYYNYKDLKDYFKAIDSNKLPIWKGLKLNEKEQIVREIMFGLKMTDGIEKSRFYDLYKEKFDKLNELGLLELNGNIKLTEKGLIFVDEVCNEFYTEEVKKRCPYP